MPELGGPPFPEILPLAREAAEMGLSLDPDLAEAHTASGYISAAFEWDWEAAEREYLKAIELSPDYATAHQWYAEMLGPSGRWEEVFTEIRIAIELDPRSPASNMMMGWLLTCTGQHAEAIQWYERSHTIAPGFVPPLAGLGDTYVSLGDYVAAASWYERADAISGADPEVARAFLAALSDPAKIPEAISVFRAGGDNLSVAVWLAHLGQADEAVAALERAFDEHSAFLPWINSRPDFDGIRSDPRFQALLRRLNCPE